MATSRYQSNDLRRQVGSPRPKTRENKDTPCRNILIYGHCRYQEQGCTYSHDQNKTSTNQNDSSKKSFNVESPSFTPASVQVASKKATFSSQAAAAPAFTPRGLAASPGSTTKEPDTSLFNPAAIQEFTPSSGFDVSSTAGSNGTGHDGAAFDPFSMSTVGQNLPAAHFNPYEDHGALSGATTAFFHAQGAYATMQPLQHHLYFPSGPRRDDLLPYNRTTHDFFIAEDKRQHITKKLEAAGQVMPNSQLPQLDNFYSLVPLDTTHRKAVNIFTFPSWVYKATSAKNGHMYCLRRLEGYRLTNEHAIRSVKEWRKVDSGCVVSTHDAFTTRAFGDSSLLFVQDYYPLAKTLAETHLVSNPTSGNRFSGKTPILEATLWGYISQIATGLQAIHSAGLAARCVDVTKIIVTDKNRVRLNGCSVLDVVQFENRRPLEDAQQDDFVQFGRTVLCLATHTLPSHLTNLSASIDQMSRTYSIELRDTVVWLLTPQQSPGQKGITEFIRGISDRIATTFDQNLRALDASDNELAREIENGRIARLMMKLGTINERPSFDGDANWAENGERYLLKLFRDYVFHQVDSNNSPVLDMGHMIRCLVKLDAGVDEKICLTSRDEQSCFVISYKELKKQLNAAFAELQKGNSRSKGLS